MIGQTSHYRVLDNGGEGSMGDVHRAPDTHLKREVAVKFLSQQFTQDSRPLARFEWEAQLLASLSHPGIAAARRVDRAKDLHFLVMELADGQDLAQGFAKTKGPPARRGSSARPN